MHGIMLLSWSLVVFAAAPAPTSAAPSLRHGEWSAWLNSPGGPLAFTMEITQGDSGLQAWLINGAERSAVPQVRVEGDAIVFDFVHYNSMIRAVPNAAGTSLEGTWLKVQGADTFTEMEFRASWMTPPPPDPRGPIPGRIDKSGMQISESRRVEGRWAVQFESSDDPAVAIFDSHPDGSVTGTFLTTTGDYRFLGGTVSNRTLHLSVFDGAHAFLFIARILQDNTLAGDFWSRDAWHETWTAQRDASAALPDAFGQTTWNDDDALEDLKFRDLDGNLVSPADARFAGRLRIIEVFGTWCPNCNDATNYLMELQETYGDRGLSILGLAFEITGDPARDAKQVRRYIDHHGIAYPVLVAGVSDKAEATKAFPVLDRVRSYPTFIFLDEAGAVQAIYTGFNGPATGAAHDKLREDFQRIIERGLGS